MRYEVRKLYRDGEGVLKILVDCFLPLPKAMNDEGWTMQASYASDPTMRHSRLALSVALQRGTIECVEGSCHICVGVSLQDCRKPDNPTREEIQSLCRKTLRQYAGLLQAELNYCYQYTGMSEVLA